MAGVIINHDQALRQREDYNLLYEPIEMMIRKEVEAWERQDPIDLVMVRDTIDRLQKTYSSDIGYDQVIAESANYAVGNISNAQSGFRKTVATRIFRGSRIIAEEVIKDSPEDIGKDLTKWTKAIMRNRVQYGLKSLDAGFGNMVKWGNPEFGPVSSLILRSADTVDGVVETQQQLPLFINRHTMVKRDFADLGPRQSNKFIAPGIGIGSTDPGQLTKFADALNWVKTEHGLWLDDNGQRVDYSGECTFVTGLDSRIETAFNIVLKENYLKGQGQPSDVYQNPAFNAGVHKFHSMFNDTDALRPVYGTYNAAGVFTPNYNPVTGVGNPNNRTGVLAGFGVFIVNKSYMSENNGLTYLERETLSIKAIQLGTTNMEPEGVGYKSYHRADVVNCTWRGISYLWVGDPQAIPATLLMTDASLVAAINGASDNPGMVVDTVVPADTPNGIEIATPTGSVLLGTGSWTKVTPVATVVKPVSVVGGTIQTTT